MRQRILQQHLQRIEILNKQYGLFSKNDTVVLGLSGGPDSIALLHLLHKLRHKHSLKIVAAHMDHQLVKTQASSHFKIAKQAALHLKVPFYHKTISVKDLAKKNKQSIEEAGRAARYQFFEEVSKKSKANKIATAHTLDDQAETLLMRIIRGTGLPGLAGIPCVRMQGKYQLIRPVLSTRKHELLLFLKQNGIPYGKDKTNDDRAFTRNRVRHS